MTKRFGLKTHHQANIAKTFKIMYNIERLFSLYRILHDLQWLLQCKIYESCIIQNLYETIYYNIVGLMMPWPVVVSKLYINNTKNK